MTSVFLVGFFPVVAAGQFPVNHVSFPLWLNIPTQESRALKLRIEFILTKKDVKSK